MVLNATHQYLLIPSSSQIYFAYLKGQTKDDPLIIFDISPFIWINSLVNSRMRNINCDSLPEGTWYGICGMNPAVSVENTFWDVICVNTINGIAKELPWCHKNWWGHKQDNRKLVAKSENCGINFHFFKFEYTLDAWKWAQHFESQKVFFSKILQFKRGFHARKNVMLNNP